jgi:hypothetical protein
MKKILFGIFIIFGLFLIGSLLELHFKEINAVPGDVTMISSSNIGECAKAVLFENKTYKTFGVARIEKKLGFLYRYDGGTWGNFVEEGKPFQADGIGNNEDFLVAIKTSINSKIKYIALGNHMEGIMPSDKYELTLDDVRKNIDEYSEDTWTIRAFNKDGKLIADELFGGDARYTDWE